MMLRDLLQYPRRAMKKFSCWVREGMPIPSHMGVVHDDWTRSEKLCCLLPFNWFWRWCLLGYWHLKAPNMSWWEKQRKAAWDNGRVIGHMQGVVEGERLGKERYKKAFEHHMAKLKEENAQRARDER